MVVLRLAGIESIDDVVTLGSIQSYLRVNERSPSSRLYLFFTLEGPLTNRHGQDFAHDERLHLLALLELVKGRKI